MRSAKIGTAAYVACWILPVALSSCGSGRKSTGSGFYLMSNRGEPVSFPTMLRRVVVLNFWRVGAHPAGRKCQEFQKLQ